MTWRWPWTDRPAIDNGRWLVVDVETSGLDPRRAQLLAIAGVALDMRGSHPQISPRDSFEVILRPRDPVQDKSNILLHGIGEQAQRCGLEPKQALSAFDSWAAQSPLMGYHASFDEIMLKRARALAGMPHRHNPWLDLAPLLRQGFAQHKGRALDDWLTAFGIHCSARHQAAADALATAQLALMLLHRLRRSEPLLSYWSLQQRAADARWLAGYP